MNKHTLQNYLCGFFTALLLVVLVVPCFAESTSKQIMATYNGIKIYVNGEKINPKDANGNSVEPFVVDGTTYLPVRAIAEAVGYDVSYDSSTQTVSLTLQTDISVTPSPSPTSTPTAAPFNTSLQSNLVSRVNACLNVANVAYKNLQTQYNDYLSRGMARSSKAQTIASAQESTKSDILVMQGMLVCISNATTNDQLAEIESDFKYYESMY